jgi:hypothetical protein
VKQASTIVRLRDGETAIIGGLISEETGETERRVPVLGKTSGGRCGVPQPREPPRPDRTS